MFADWAMVNEHMHGSGVLDGDMIGRWSHSFWGFGGSTIVLVMIWV